MTFTLIFYHIFLENSYLIMNNVTALSCYINEILTRKY